MSKRAWPIGFLAVVVGLTAFSPWRHNRGAAIIRATPRPEFRGAVETVPRAELLRYAQSLTFDASHDASDESRLRRRVNGVVKVGTLTRIAPEIGSAKSFPLGEGRILARIWSQEADAFQGLGRGDNYVWFDSTGGRFRAVIIPSDPSVAISVKHATRLHSGTGTGFAEARWRWNERLGVDDGWARCDDGCCRIEAQ